MQRSIRSFVAAALLGLAALCAALLAAPRADAQQIGPIPGCTISGGTITCGSSSLTPGSCTTTANSLQYNNAGALGCVSGWTTNGSTALTGGAGTTLAIGGATIGSNTLAVTGSQTISGQLVVTATGIAIKSNGAGAYYEINNTGGITWANRSAIDSAADGQLRFGNNAQTNTTSISFPTATATPTFQLGALDAAVAVAQTTRVQSVVAGTAAANGANWTLVGSLPTGPGTSGDIIFQTGVKTGSGTTQGTATTALTIKGETQQVQAGFNTPSNTIMLALGSTSLGLLSSGTNSLVFSGANSNISTFAGTAAFFFNSDTTSQLAVDVLQLGRITQNTYIVRAAAANIQLGLATGSGAAVAQTLSVQGSSGNSAAAALFTIAGSDQSGTTTTGGEVRIRGGNGTSAGGAVTIYTSATTTPAVAVTFGADKSATFTGQISVASGTATGTTAGVTFAGGGANAPGFYSNLTDAIGFRNANAAHLVINAGSLIAKSAYYIGWSATSDPTGASDITLSRSAAGVVQVGTSAANALGSLNLVALTATGLVTSATLTVTTMANVATTSAVCYNTATGVVTYDGTLGTCTVSDERLKNMGERIPNALARLLQIDGIYYDWRDPQIMGIGRQIGVSAQTVAKVFPELVQSDSNGVMRADYQRLAAPIIEAMREMNDRLVKLEAK